MMNLTLHIVRSDLARMRIWLVCWVGVLVVPLLIGAWLLANSPFNGSDDWNLPNTIQVLTGLQVVVAYVITILLIHEHRIVGTQQFWLTRPISRGRLLTAKALGLLGVIGLLPVLVSIPWWWWCGFDPGQMTHAAAELVAIMMIIVLPAVVVAVLTDSFARALLWSLVFLAVILFVASLLAFVNGAFVRNSHQMALIVSRSVVALLIVAIELAGVVAGQFFVRRRGWWLGAAGALMAASVFAATFWSRPWVPDEPTEHHVELAAGVTMQWNGATVTPAKPMNGELLQGVDLRYVVRGVPSQFMLMGYGAKMHWQWAAGLPIDRVDSVTREYGPELDPVLRFESYWAPVTAAVRRARGPGGNGGVPRAPLEFIEKTSAFLQRSAVVRMEKDPPEFSARLWWQAIRPELRFEVPVAPGSWKASGGHGLRIDRVKASGRHADIIMVESSPVTIAGILRNIVGRSSIFRRFPSDEEHWLVTIDRERNAIVDSFAVRDEKPRAALVNGVKVLWSVRSVRISSLSDTTESQTASDVAGRCTIGVVTGSEEAVFSREVKLNRFELNH